MLQLSSTPALLIIDMQNAFCHKDGSFSKLSMLTSPTSLIPHINSLRTAFRSANLPIIYLATAYKEDYSDRRTLSRGDSLEQLRGLIRGTWDAEILSSLTPQLDYETVVEKTRYSAFFNTPLEAMLRAKRVDFLVLTGVGTDVCVDTTARDAYMRDFEVVTVRDATGTTNEEDHLRSLRALRMFGGTALSADVVEAVESRRQCMN